MDLHLMIDIETTGIRYNAGILSIAAQAFKLPLVELVGEPFYVEIDRSTGTFWKDDQSTIDWWSEQDPEVREQAFSGKTHVNDAFKLLADYVNGLKDYAAKQTLPNEKSRVITWGNSSRFDIEKIAFTFDQLGISEPWDSYEERCYRTMVREVCPTAPKAVRREGKKHCPISDALYQIKVLGLIYQNRLS